MPTQPISVSQGFKQLDPFDLTRVLAGEEVVHHAWTINRLKVVEDPPNDPIILVWFDEHRSLPVLAWDFAAAKRELHMAPRPPETRTVWLNIYPLDSDRCQGHEDERTANKWASSTRQGAAVRIDLIRDKQGNWQVNPCITES